MKIIFSKTEPRCVNDFLTSQTLNTQEQVKAPVTFY